MWRESWRRVTVVVVALVAAACTNGDAGSTTTTEESPGSTAIETTTTTAPPTTTTTTETTTTATEFTDAVGSPEALDQELQEVRGFVSLLYSAEAAAALPSPDLTAPDPAEAMQELLRFESNAIQIATVRQYADLLAVADSPAYGSFRRDLDGFENNQLRAVFEGDYTVHYINIVTTSDIAPIAGEGTVDQAPFGSVFVAYETSLDPYNIVRQDGTLVQEEAGWDRRSRFAIISPTDSGWKYFWVES